MGPTMIPILYKQKWNNWIFSLVIINSAAFAKPITLICRQSYMEGALPVAWRVANVTPIFKKGSRLDPANYRPVSLTSVVCKVAEKCFCVQCSNFLNSNSLLSPHQHGFVTGKACVTNLQEMGDIISRGVAKRRWMDMMLLDFAKAFDTVSHPRLLHKLAAYGIIGANLRCIRAFLTDRQQRVVMGDTTSNWVSVTSGVPQGSVLGPFLFVVYINDMPDRISNHIKLYADDTKLAADVGPPAPSCHTTPPSSSNRLQLDVDRASQWSDTWRLRLHPDKSIVIHFGRGNPCRSYDIDGRTLKSSWAGPRRHDQLWPQVAWASCARVGQSDEDARPPEEHLRLEEHLDLADALHHVRPPAPWVRCPGLATAPWERHRRDRASSATRYKAHARDPRSRLSRPMQVPWHWTARASSRERRLDPNVQARQRPRQSPVASSTPVEASEGWSSVEAGKRDRQRLRCASPFLHQPYSEHMEPTTRQRCFCSNC